jgi:O-acetyl-ADP-ribose deacetylase (regulator of RNase III)
MSSDVRLHLVDSRGPVVDALAAAFRAFPEVTVHLGDILSVARSALVSPANGYGFMDGGVDHAYLKFFGDSLELAVQHAIAARPEAHLPVGASIIVPTGNPAIPFLIVAPTMLMPEPVPRENAYRALRAVLRVAGPHDSITDVFSPALGTGVGHIAPDEAAQQMSLAYADWKSASATTAG